jgi:hypothetical protein
MSAVKKVPCRMCGGIGRVTKYGFRGHYEGHQLAPVGEVLCTFCHGNGHTTVAKELPDYAEDIRHLEIEIARLWAYIRGKKL